MHASLLQQVLHRLGFSATPPATAEGLAALYAAWCRAVPFDNVRKSIALHRNDRAPLPGSTAEDFFESWLRHGTGGTCWAGSTALFALVDSLGFDARRAVGSMRDLGVPNHGTVKVRAAGGDVLVDSSMLVGFPVPIGGASYRDTRGGGVEVEPSAAGDVVWFDTPPHAELFPCRLLLDGVDAAYFVDAYERSRVSSPFNQSLYARRNRDGARIVLRGATRFERTPLGTTEEALDRDALCAALRSDFGFSAEIVAAWAACGALEACYTPTIGPNTAPVSLLPPSKRQVAAPV